MGAALIFIVISACTLLMKFILVFVIAVSFSTEYLSTQIYFCD